MVQFDYEAALSKLMAPRSSPLWVTFASSRANNEEAIKALFARLVGTATKREIMDANPGISQRTLERILSKLQDEGAVEKVGTARATTYRTAK